MEYTLIPEVSLASQTLTRGESLTARLASRTYLRVWSARLPWSDVIFSLPLSSPVRLVCHGGRRLIHIHHEPTAVSTVSEKSERDTHWNNLCGTFSSSLSRAIHESRAEYESSAGFTSTPAGMTWTMYLCWLHSNRTDIDTMKEIGGFICSSYSSLPFLVSRGQTLPRGRVWSTAKHARGRVWPCKTIPFSWLNTMASILCLCRSRQKARAGGCKYWGRHSCEEWRCAEGEGEEGEGRGELGAAQWRCEANQ